MKLILFLGAGVSIPSGHPDAEQLTNRILDGDSNESRFLKLLHEYDKKASRFGTALNSKTHEAVGEIYRNSTTYEDLYYLCDEIATFDWGLHTNSMVPAFIQSLAAFLNEQSADYSIESIGKYGHAAKKYINKLVIDNLVTPENISGFDVIIQLANSPYVSSLNILTLNHDLLVESILLKHFIDFADGFRIKDGDVKWFDPDNFLIDTKVKLLKLHGSVDWYSAYVEGYEKIAKISHENISMLKNALGQPIQFSDKSPKILSGLNKIKYYNYGFYTDLHYHFQRILYENSIMIMSGYGWGDEAINIRLMTWLDKKKENKLILLHENPEMLMQRELIFDRDYSNWVKYGKLKPILKWLQHTNAEEVLSACSL